MIYRINDYCSVVISTIANLALLYLIFTKTSKEMKAYQKILLQTCVVDLMLILTSAMTEPIISFQNGNEIAMNNGIFRNISARIDFILVGIWLFALCFSYCSISIQFIYRYFALVKGIWLKGWSFVVLISIPIFVNILHVVVCGLYFYPTEAKLKLAKEQFGPYFVNGEVEKLSGWIGAANAPDTWIVAFDMFTLTAGGYAVAIWCNIKIWSHLKNHMKTASHSEKSMNAQLNKTLIAQAIGPLGVSVIPMLTFVYCIVFKGDTAVFTAWIGLPMALIPLVNPVLTIWFVKPYRRAIFGMFKRNVQIYSETQPRVHIIDVPPAKFSKEIA